MPIKAEITRQPGSSLKLNISIDAEDVTAAFKSAYSEFSRKIKMKGFRPGKVPVGVIKMKYSTAVSQEVLDKLLNNAFTQAIKDNDLHPVSRGEIDAELPELKEGEAFNFSMTADVYPEFDLPQYTELPVTRNSYEIKDKDIDAEIAHLAERFATIEDIEAGTVASDSLVVLDYDVEFNGEIIEELSRAGVCYDQAQGIWYPIFGKGLRGLAAGESKDFKSSFPKEFGMKEKAGKDMVFKVKVVRIQKRVLPEINDEFVRKISTDTTLEEFKTNIRKNMEQHVRQQQSFKVQTDIMAQLVKVAEIDLPKSMVQSQISREVATLKKKLLSSRSTLEQFLEESGKTEEGLREEFTEPAQNLVKTVLILNAISKNENIKAEEGEIKEEVERLARIYNATFEETRIRLAREGKIESIAFDIRRKKTMEMLESKAKIEQGKTLDYAELQTT